MKELSIEQKAKAYDEALERVWELLSRCKNNRDRRTMVYRVEDIESIFPELKKSEDEMIRREIINYFQCQSGEEPTRKEIHNKWISWLENIPYTIDHEKREGFHLGYKAFLERQGEQKAEENKGNIGGVSPNSEWSVEDTFKVQRICKYLNEAKKYYADITEVRECIDWLKSLKDRVQPQPKQEWSEEDEKRLNSCLNILRPKTLFGNTEITNVETINTKWLKSLKDRVGCEVNCTTTKEWSDEDERNMQNIDSVLFYDKALPEDTCVKLRNFLKSLKQRICGGGF